MIQMAPPSLPPRVAVDDDDNLNRLHFRLRQLTITVITVLLTVWCCTFGWVAAIAGLMIAKHVLVAILIMGMDYQALHPADPQESD